MPIYDYECHACKNQFEVEAKMSDAPPGACPSCGNSGLRRLISKTSFVLKGGGWYVTDYKSKKKDHGTKPDADPPAVSPQMDSASKVKDSPTSDANLPTKEGGARDNPTKSDRIISTDSPKAEVKPKASDQ